MVLRTERTGSTSICLFPHIFGTKYCVERRPLAKDLWVGLFFCSEVNHPCVRAEQSRGRSNFVLEILKLKMIRQYTSLILARNLFILDCFWREKKKKGLLVSISNAIFSILNFVSNSNKFYSRSKNRRDVYKNFNSKLIYEDFC